MKRMSKRHSDGKKAIKTGEREKDKESESQKRMNECEETGESRLPPNWFLLPTANSPSINVIIGKHPDAYTQHTRCKISEKKIA